MPLVTTTDRRCGTRSQHPFPRHEFLTWEFVLGEQLVVSEQAISYTSGRWTSCACRPIGKKDCLIVDYLVGLQLLFPERTGLPERRQGQQFTNKQTRTQQSILVQSMLTTQGTRVRRTITTAHEKLVTERKSSARPSTGLRFC